MFLVGQLFRLVKPLALGFFSDTIYDKYQTFYDGSPRGLTFTWWGCHGLCLRHKLNELAHSFLFCFCVCFCLHGPFNFISILEFSRQLSVFSLTSSGLISASLVLSKIYLFMKISFSPDIIHSGCLGSEHQLTN